MCTILKVNNKLAGVAIDTCHFGTQEAEIQDCPEFETRLCYREDSGERGGKRKEGREKRGRDGRMEKVKERGRIK